MEVPVFYPTYDEFKDFSAFVASIEARGAHKIGLAKIVPPKEWKARQLGYKQKQIADRIVENPIKQEVHGRDGAYSVYNIQQNSVKVSSFQRMAASNRYAPPTAIANDYEKLEKKYWLSLTTSSPIYGADVSGSLYDEDQTVWNVNNLGTILDDLATEYGAKIQGVNTAYLYYGMWRASFAWHTEDMDLYSINYLHFGASKQWYVIPPSSARKFEQLAASRFPSLARRCPAFLRHKMTIISPNVLTENGIPYSKMTQNENEFIITFPFGYHAGFNYGFNCAESTNFALERWIEYGKHSVKCTCREDMVKISMDRFVLKYQPEMYESWCRGINVTRHPEDELAQQIVRTSPTKQRPIFQEEALSTVISPQQQHQERVRDERYSCIFRNLAKFDKQKQMSIADHPIPLIRAALSRARFKMQKNPKGNLNKLLCFTANQIVHSSYLNPFYGLKQSGKYREHILTHLWSYQSFCLNSEQAFHRYLQRQSDACSICYLFSANKHSQPRYQFCLVEDDLAKENEMFQCAACDVHVHQRCYESICLAMNVQLTAEECDSWLCQRCLLREASSNVDDRCSLCLLRGGLLLRPHQSSTFEHAICSIYQAFQPSSSSASSTTLTCHYCSSFCPLNYRKISTHQMASCQYSKCPHRFHITCGVISGCTFTFDPDQQIVDARCHLHASTCSISSTRSSSIDDTKEATIDEDILDESKRLSNGTRVVVEQKIGQIIRHELSYHYSVDFGDDTFSHDMLAEDILDSNTVVGSNIRIRWTDGTIYPCKYLGRKRVLLYHIQIGRDIRQMQRHEFSVDIQPPSPPPTPCPMDAETNSSVIAKKTKRTHQQAPIKRKRCRRLLLSSSSSSSSSDES